MRLEGALAAAYAFVFAAAAVGKLTTFGSWRRLVEAIVERRRVARAAAVAVPVAEAGVAVAVVARPAAGLLAAGSLLLAFSIVVGLGRKRLAGRTCGCFGRFLPAKFGLALLLRNGILAAGAITLAAGRAPSPRLDELLLGLGCIGVFAIASRQRRIESRPLGTGLPRRALLVLAAHRLAPVLLAGAALPAAALALPRHRRRRP